MSEQSTSTNSSPPIEKAKNTSESKKDDNKKDDDGMFECNICFEPAQEPVVTVCGHLFCWPCLYKWTHSDTNMNNVCPVCKAGIDKDKIIPLYGRGRSSPSANINQPPKQESQIPQRPRGQRPDPVPNPNYQPQSGHIPGGFAHFGNPQFSDAFSFFPFFTPFGGFGFTASFGGGHHNTQMAQQNDAQTSHQQVLSRFLFFLGTLILVVIFMS